VVLALVLVAVIAAWIPARRASAVDAISAEKILGGTVAEAKPAGKPRILRSSAHVQAARRVEFVAMHEEDAQAR
jgi:hypothetical protein